MNYPDPPSPISFFIQLDSYREKKMKVKTKLKIHSFSDPEPMDSFTYNSFPCRSCSFAYSPRKLGLTIPLPEPWLRSSPYGESCFAPFPFCFHSVNWREDDS